MSGFLLVLLGAWGALVPFIGPSFHYAYTPDSSWTYTSGRMWLEVLPGIGALLGGLIVLAAAMRPMAVFGAWLAAMSGAWFAVGTPLSTLWTAHGTPAAGVAVGGTVTRAVEQVGFFAGLGAAVIFFAALALGRFTVIGAREASLAADEAATQQRAEDQQETDQRVAGQHAADERPASGRLGSGRRLFGRRASGPQADETGETLPAQERTGSPAAP